MIKGWKGKPIDTAIEVLGAPDKTVLHDDTRLYVWHTERPENVRVLGGGEIVLDGHIDNPTPDHFNIDASCKIIIATHKDDDIIIASAMKGQILTCTQLSEKIVPH